MAAFTAIDTQLHPTLLLSVSDPLTLRCTNDLASQKVALPLTPRLIREYLLAILVTALRAEYTTRGSICIQILSAENGAIHVFYGASMEAAMHKAVFGTITGAYGAAMEVCTQMAVTGASM